MPLNPTHMKNMILGLNVSFGSKNLLERSLTSSLKNVGKFENY